MENKYITFWLQLMCLLVVLMIVIGGYTRLTDSGLSITQWKPISGIVPPLNEVSWMEEFEKYQQSPEYIKINQGMDLQEFKSIFWVEFIHRIVGRITGVIYLIPLIFFILKGNIKNKDIKIYLFALLLFLGQGFMGWYMVKSGLILDPHVSHFRLAIHLLLAMCIYSIFFWQLAKNSFDPIIVWSDVNLSKINYFLNISLIILFIQITLGAFVAGLDAGLVYNNFPLMGDSFIPKEIILNKINIDSFYDPVFVQFMHRIVGYILTITILITCIVGFKIANKTLSKVLVYLSLAIIFQITAGIVTLVCAVPIFVALIHQFGAIIVLSLLLWAKWMINQIVESRKNFI